MTHRYVAALPVLGLAIGLCLSPGGAFGATQSQSAAPLESRARGDEDERGAAEKHDEHNDEGRHGPRGAEKHEEDGHGHEEPANEVRLDAQQRATLGIRTERVVRRPLGEAVAGPGEVRLNAYATAEATPRIAAQVVARLARLGDRVEATQPLATLSSVEMADAQGQLLVAEREWQRVRALGERVVSERRFIEARVAREQARARVLAYGMTEGQVKALLRGGPAKANGTFQLLAPQAGTVIEDAFHVGELVEAGRRLFRITNEDVRWVEARLRPKDAAQVTEGSRARIKYQDTWLDGTVAQVHRQLDEATRTLGVRIELPDLEHRVVPGNFVEVVIEAGSSAPVLALPEQALQRSPDGDWQVFVAESGGTFKPTEVDVVRRAAGLAVVDGLAEGSEVVTEGAFFLQSELAKSGFDIHAH